MQSVPSNYERVKFALEEWGRWIAEPIYGLSHAPISRTGKIMELGPDGMLARTASNRALEFTRNRNAARTHRVLCELDDETLICQKLQYHYDILLSIPETAIKMRITEARVYELNLATQQHMIKRLDLEKPTYAYRPGTAVRRKKTNGVPRYQHTDLVQWAKGYGLLTLKLTSKKGQ